MADKGPLTIVNVGYLSTNYWVVSAGRSRLLIDLGYPGSMGTLRARLKQMDIPLHEICYGVATHYHIDHAGLGQELRLAGVPLLVLKNQVPFIPLMKRFTKPRNRYVEIDLDSIEVITFEESREVLRRIGIPGEILPTPGHSDDSISVLLDDGSAFTGDLTPVEGAWGEAAEKVMTSWRLLCERGAKMIYPAHGPIRAISREG